VRVEVDRDGDCLFETRDQLVGVIGRNDARHILDAQRISPQVFDLPCLVHVIADVEYGTAQSLFRQRIGDGALDMPAAVLDCPEGGRAVALIVKSIEDAENIDTHIATFFNKGIHNVIGIISVPDKVLSPKQHLELRIGHLFLEKTYPLPWVFIKKTGHHVEGGPAPDFQGIETDGIQLLGNRQHVFSPHSGGKQRLVAVPQS